jgi:hypothetical protein
MQTNIAYSLKGQNTRLLAELWNQRRSKTANELALILRYELSKTVCDMIWDVHLLKTSIIITKTPWTTLNSLSRKYIGSKHNGHGFTSNAKEKMFEAVKDIKEDLLRALKQFAEYH